MSNQVKKKSGNQPAAKGSQKRTNFLPLLAVAALGICAVVVMMGSGKGGTTENGKAGWKSDGAVTLASGESLIIPTAEITTHASFYPVRVDGTSMEIIAVRDSRGDIRTALNTCQICYSSGRGYYVQVGNNLVCQNCGNRFSMDQVEVIAGGCNPIPILDQNKTVTADEILISYDFLAEAERIFANWKN